MPGFVDIPGPHLRTSDVPGNATAGTADEWPLFVAPFNCTVTAVTFTAVAAVTGAATNNFALTCRNRGAAGTGTTAVASLTFGSGTNATAFVPKAVTLSATAADLNLTAGDVLTAEKLVNGTGLAMPKGAYTVEFKVR